MGEKEDAEEHYLRQEWLKYAFEKDKIYLLISIGSVAYFFNEVCSKSEIMPIFLRFISILVIGGFSLVIFMILNIFEKNQEFLEARILRDEAQEENVKTKLIRYDSFVKWAFLSAVACSVIFLFLTFYGKIHFSNKKQEKFMGKNTYFVADSIAKLPPLNPKRTEKQETTPELLTTTSSEKKKSEANKGSSQKP